MSEYALHSVGAMSRTQTPSSILALLPFLINDVYVQKPLPTSENLSDAPMQFGD